MRLNNAEKHQVAVNLVSKYLAYLGYEFTRNEHDTHSDIKICDSDKEIKIFSNFSRSPNIKVARDFETKDNVLYLVVSPTDRNNVGFTSVGGSKEMIDGAIKTFKTEKSPNNIDTTKLKNFVLKQFLNS